MADASNAEWKDISSETFREYTFPGGEQIRINAPVKLWVRPSGSHCVIDKNGLTHWVSSKFLSITWDGATLF